MRQTLQNKFNALGVVLILFFLLMLPMFTQVRADTRDSLKQAHNTFLAEMFRDVQKDLKPPNLENTEVEDYWAKEARENDPNCGEACDPNADRDGDGMSNVDELKAGRNPSCNEDQHGTEFCKNQDPHKLTDPENLTQQAQLVWLGNVTYTMQDCQAPAPLAANTCPMKPFQVPVNTLRLDFYLNVTQFTGNSYTMRIQNQSNDIVASFSRSGGALQGPGASHPMQSDSTDDVAEPGEYRVSLSPQAVQEGRWNLSVYGLVVS